MSKTDCFFNMIRNCCGIPLYLILYEVNKPYSFSIGSDGNTINLLKFL